MAHIYILKADGSTQSFEIRRVPTRGISFARCVTVEGRILGMSRTGSLYSVHGFPTARGAFVGCGAAYVPVLAKALHALGVINEADRDATIAAHKEEQEISYRTYAVQQIEHHAKELGLLLTKAQQVKLDSLRRKQG